MGGRLFRLVLAFACLYVASGAVTTDGGIRAMAALAAVGLALGAVAA
jgi:hypothetical protein